MSDEAPPPSQDVAIDPSSEDVAQDFEDAQVYDHPPVLPGEGGLGAQGSGQGVAAPGVEEEVVLPHALPGADDTAGSEEDEFEEPKVELPETTPSVDWPTVAEYQTRWDTLLEHHRRGNEDVFSAENLVPQPVSQLWQDCPYVPFDKLTSQAAQERLGLCRPLSGLQESGNINGVERYLGYLLGPARHTTTS